MKHNISVHVFIYSQLCRFVLSSGVSFCCTPLASTAARYTTATTAATAAATITFSTVMTAKGQLASATRTICRCILTFWLARRWNVHYINVTF
jgi:hypothetical protein